MEIDVQDGKALALQSLLNEARAEADTLRKRLEKFEKVLISSRLIMGHELKKPSTAITGYLDLVLEELDDRDHSSVCEMLYKARSECDLLNELNLFFLELLKVDGRPEVMHGGQVTVRDFVAETIRHLPDNLNPSTRVKTRISTQLNTFNINPNAFKIILTNIIENALKYSTDDDSSVLVEIKKEQDKRDVAGRDLLKIAVTDNGVGIPANEVKRIFVPFVRLHGELSEGAGLGLTLVRSLVDLNGGNVHIRSEEGEGTTVLVIIPEVGSGERTIKL